MPVPQLTDEQRRAALVKAAEARAQRKAFLEDIRDGKLTFAAALQRADADPVLARTKVETVLKAVPRVGDATVAKWMTAVGIDSKRKLSGLGEKQRRSLRELAAA